MHSYAFLALLSSLLLCSMLEQYRNGIQLLALLDITQCYFKTWKKHPNGRGWALYELIYILACLNQHEPGESSGLSHFLACRQIFLGKAERMPEVYLNRLKRIFMRNGAPSPRIWPAGAGRLSQLQRPVHRGHDFPHLQLPTTLSLLLAVLDRHWHETDPRCLLIFHEIWSNEHWLTCSSRALMNADFVFPSCRSWIGYTIFYSGNYRYN